MISQIDVIIATACEADRHRLATLLRRRAAPFGVVASPCLTSAIRRAGGTLDDADGRDQRTSRPQPPATGADQRRDVCVLTDARTIGQSPPATAAQLLLRGGGLASVVLQHAGGDERRLAALLPGNEEWGVHSFPWREIDGGEAGVDGLVRAIRHAVEIAELEARLGRRAEEIARLNRALSHDLSAPIGSLQRLLDLSLKALAGGDATTAGQVVARARAAAKRAGRLIKALETHASIGEAASDGVETRPTALSAVAQAAVETVAAERRADGDAVGPDFEISIQPLPEATICGARLTQVLEELLRNALLFNDAARPEIMVRALTSDTGVEITVEDNGIGVETPYLDAIFEPLTRLHGPQSYPGSGLGLATCRRLVLEMGGRIWAENRTPGDEGLRIHLLLPR